MNGQSKREEVDPCRSEACLRLFADEVSAGLSATPKELPCKYLYDEEGSRLFKEIMELEEYYPTGCEAEILERHKADIAACVGSRALNVVELDAAASPARSAARAVAAISRTPTPIARSSTSNVA